ncbi:tryptophan synthase beta subunit-like PLP-dependent enzyme [Colletotrichum sublineola]|nr:tryptophan synthase beta subunit-like PLP-dependent enzyme [Colletotrichum sublineola]
MSEKRAPAPVDTVLDAIGNTPCVRLRRVVPEGCASVYVKLESLNPTGSYKDRLAKATGGSTGSSLAFVCSLKGYRFIAVCSDAFAKEKLRTMAAFGAEVENVHSHTGKITSDLFAAIVKRAKTIVEENEGYYAADQFNNKDCIVGYSTLGDELVEQLPQGIDAFCGAAGGAGMVMGTSKVLKAARPDTRVVVLEPSTLYDEIRAYPEEEAREMCCRLAKEEGILAGTSTGLNVVAALALAKELGPGKVVVTVACDTGLEYMSGNLYE